MINVKKKKMGNETMLNKAELWSVRRINFLLICHSLVPWFLGYFDLDYSERPKYFTIAFCSLEYSN